MSSSEQKKYGLAFGTIGFGAALARLADNAIVAIGIAIGISIIYGTTAPDTTKKQKIVMILLGGVVLAISFVYWLYYT